MELDVIDAEGVATVVIRGRVDSATTDDLREALNELVASGATRLVIDLQGVDYLSSAGLREFMAVLKRVNQHGGIRLASPSERVQSVLEISGMDSLFAVYQTRRDAVSSY